jgi:hypothetical protein
MAILLSHVLKGKNDGFVRKQLVPYLKADGRSAIGPLATPKDASHPWLLAARVLRSKGSYKLKSWDELWSVLRWYAHNRGYDGNARWSADFQMDGFSEQLADAQAELTRQKESAELREKESGEDEEVDSDASKLDAAGKLVSLYGFTTNTFAECMAKLLLGPAREIQAGDHKKAGKFLDNKDFPEQDFDRLLFDLPTEFTSHPRHLSNSYKKMRATFPRRVPLPETRTLAGGVEWEVRFILRAHFDSLPGCDALLERALCGALPEDDKQPDWMAFAGQLPQMYLGAAEKVRLTGDLKIPRMVKTAAEIELKKTILAARHEFLNSKLILPKRYRGGLLFGQLVPRFDNRIIGVCPFAFAEIREAVELIDDPDLETRGRSILSLYGLTVIGRDDLRAKLPQRVTESDEVYAYRLARKMAKLPSKHSFEFLEYRWAMVLANIRIGRQVETYGVENGKPILSRPLTLSERRKVDAAVKKRGVLEYKEAETKPKKDKATGDVRMVTKPCINELREIVIRECGLIPEDRDNLDALMLAPNAKEALKLVPSLRGGKDAEAAFQLAWSELGEPQLDSKGHWVDAPLRRRFTRWLLDNASDKGKGRPLSLAIILEELRKLGEGKCDGSIVAFAIEGALSKAACDKKGRPDAKRREELLHAEFRGKKLQGRAPYSRHKLVAAAQQVFGAKLPPGSADDVTPLHPKQRQGALEETQDILASQVGRPLAEMTNNQLVRHRLLILCGEEASVLNRKRGLLDDIVRDYAGDDKTLIKRVTVELARDLQTMSGMSNKDKLKELSGRNASHSFTAKKLAEMIVDVKINGRQVVVGGGLLKKARIADDMLQNTRALSWPCPYSENVLFTAAQIANGSYDKDHIIPRSKRLSDALEALVITKKVINQKKANRTAMEFIKWANSDDPDARSFKQEHAIRSIASYRAFVEALPTRGHAEDRKRQKRRKQLLLVESWEEKEFTPADLAKTRHLTKLAAQKISAYFGGTGVAAERKDGDFKAAGEVPVITLPGMVTKVFRDQTWKLLPLIGKANPEVLKLHERCQQAKAQGKDFNFKKEVRGTSHLHHAVDAVAIAYVTELLVPTAEKSRTGNEHLSLNGDLARLIAKGKLSVAERQQFESLCASFGLPRFYRWASKTCEDKPQPPIDSGDALLCIKSLDEVFPPAERRFTDIIRDRLAELRIVQHVPSDQSGLGRKVGQNTRSIQAVRDSSGLVLWQHGLDDLSVLDEIRNRTNVESFELKLAGGADVGESGGDSDDSDDEEEKGDVWTSVAQVVGFQPTNGIGKLKELRGVRLIRDNYGLAILQNAQPDQRFKVVSWFKVSEQLRKLKRANKGAAPILLRIGMWIQVEDFKRKGIQYKSTHFMVNTIERKGMNDALFALKPRDVVRLRFKEFIPGKDKPKNATTAGCLLGITLEQLVRGGFAVLRPGTNIDLCGTTLEEPEMIRE